MVAVTSDKSRNIFVFGGCLDKAFNHIIERYDTVMNVWVTLTIKIHFEFDQIRHKVILQPSILILGTYKSKKKSIIHDMGSMSEPE